MELPRLMPEKEPRRRVLDNGATLLTRVTPDALGVSVGVWIRTGTRHEPDGVGGISHLLEHMVFKGTGRRTAFELARDMEAIGASLDAFTTKEYTAYTVRVLPSQLSTALSILNEMLCESEHPEDQLTLEKQVVVEEILSSDDNPEDFVHERFMERLLPTHPLRLPILGTRESVMAIRREQLVEQMRGAHRGGNVIVAAAGSVGAREEKILAEAFSFGNGAALPEPPEPDLAGSAPCIENHPRELAQQYLEIGIPTGGLDHPDRYALVLLGNILGGGMSSRLFQRVREQEGLAYSIYSYADFHSDTGLLSTSLSASPENARRALTVIAQEYERLGRGELEDDEIEMNRAQVLGSMVLGLEGSMNQMSRLARSEMFYGRFVLLEEMLERVRAISGDDLVRLARQYLDPAQQTLVGHGPVEEFGFSSS